MGDMHLTISGEAVPVSVRVNPRARRLILKVDPGERWCGAGYPHKGALDEALAFAHRQNDWIRARRAECDPPVVMAPGCSLPLRGEPHLIVHEPDARRGVWISRPAQIIHVSGLKDHVPRRVMDWLKRQAKADVSARVAVHCATLAVTASRVSIRDTRSRWGSCSSSGALSFSWRLILAPPFVLDYVAAHEVAHLVHHDHSPAFWALVRRLTSHTGEASQWLKQNGAALHRFGKIPDKR